MLAVGEGSSRDAQERIQLLGATNIIIRSMKPSDEARSQSMRTSFILNYGLKYEDFDRIVATIPTVRKAVPTRECRKEVRHLEHAMDSRIVETTHDYDEFNHLMMERGRFLSESDDAKVLNYAVLGNETARTLFPFNDPIGEAVKIGSDFYTVIGVTRERGSTGSVGGSLSGQNYNRDVYIPMSTGKLRFGELLLSMRSGSFEAERIQLSQITVQVESIPQVRPTHQIIEAALKPWHYRNKDVEIIVTYELLIEAQRTARQFSFILGTIASISLLVGGIGIMNIMLATVTERTREIGIRRALGAKAKHITQQFLIETVVLSGVGGLLGIAVGVAIPHLIVYFIPEQKVIVTGSSVLLSFGISVAVGILFGLYPARRAAMMDPIEALRHE